jgi:hypothetical protein
VKDPRDTLQILAVFHYAVGAMMALVGLAPIVIGAVGAAMAAPGGDEAIRTEGAQVAAALGLGCTVTLFLGMAALGALTVFAGRSLATARRHGLCLAAAGIESLFFPFGTALGIVTLTFLLKPEVKELFVQPPASPESS